MLEGKKQKKKKTKRFENLTQILDQQKLLPSSESRIVGIVEVKRKTENTIIIIIIIIIRIIRRKRRLDKINKAKG